MINKTKHILITGATGNIGLQVINYLFKNNTSLKVSAAVRDIKKVNQFFDKYPQLEFRTFDFEDPSTYNSTLKNITTLFLLRPPNITDIKGVYDPLLETARQNGVKEIIFLSVQGAEKSKVIPHNKIERIILSHKMDYVFIRPSYFMQNLTTTLYRDIKEKRKIILHAGNAKFNWIDIENIGEVISIILNNFADFKNQAIEITGSENKDFNSVVNLINMSVANKIEYRNVNPFRFYKIKKRDGLPTGLIFVMIFLHALPKFQKEPKISNRYFEITGKEPTTLSEFVNREINLFK